MRAWLMIHNCIVVREIIGPLSLRKLVTKLMASRIYLLNATGTIPDLYCAIWRNAGSAMSKCCRGGLHQPPLLLGKAKFGGQKFVAVTTMVAGLHHLGSSAHLIS